MRNRGYPDSCYRSVGRGFRMLSLSKPVNVLDMDPACSKDARRTHSPGLRLRTLKGVHREAKLGCYVASKHNMYHFIHLSSEVGARIFFNTKPGA
jgi:hypothetical protein